LSIEELKKQFILDEDILKTRLEAIVAKALEHCRIDKGGQVLLTTANLSGRDQLKLVLAARAIASQLETGISADVTVAEIEKYTGLPSNQVRARGKECIAEKFASSSATGVYRAVAYKVEGFLDELTAQKGPSQRDGVTPNRK
jgi:hypothetical protein